MTARVEKDSNHEIFPTQKFLHRLYEKTSEWLIKEKQGVIKAKFENTKGTTFNPIDGLRKIDVRKGLFIDTANGRFALILGNINDDRFFREEKLCFRFGFFPKEGNHYKKDDLRFGTLLYFTDQRPFNYGSGEFIDAGSPLVNCWADNMIYGGEELNQTLTERELMSAKGLEKCIRLIHRTATQGF